MDSTGLKTCYTIQGSKFEALNPAMNSKFNDPTSLSSLSPASAFQAREF